MCLRSVHCACPSVAPPPPSRTENWSRSARIRSTRPGVRCASRARPPRRSSTTFGVPVPGVYMPDLDRAGCILYWGYNPSVARLAHATATTAAVRRGAKLVVIDPRRAGLAHKADHWLRVRPGTDLALALSLTGALIDNGWYDEEFVRGWTNAPLLVRSDDGRLLRDGDKFLAWDGGAVAYERTDAARYALTGSFEVGGVACRPVF